jgi:TonB family protein
VVSTDGSVEHASLLTPSRYKGFNQSALAAARKWTFAPATRGGVAVKSETDIEVEFRLTDDR